MLIPVELRAPILYNDIITFIRPQAVVCATKTLRAGVLDSSCGPSRAKSAPRSLRRALFDATSQSRVTLSLR